MNRFKTGDVVQKSSADVRYIVTGFSFFYGRFCWHGISETEHGNGYSEIDSDDWDFDVIDHYKPKQMFEKVNRIRNGG